jgi:hypothetical protein
MTVTANQPILLRRLRALPWTEIGVAGRERARGHGRAETRSVSVVSLDPCPDLGREFLPGARRFRRRLRPSVAIGRRIEVAADLEHVTLTCAGRW